MGKGKSAIVTGGASGIGKAVVERLAKEGWAVTVVDINDTEGKAVAAAITTAGGRAHYVHADVSDEEQVKAMVNSAVAAFGKLDAAVNSAGIPQSGKPLFDVSVEAWDRCNAVNLRGMFLCIKHQVRAMWDNGSGVIVAISSPAGVSALPNSAEYCASKAGINGLVRAAARDCAERKIRINALLPGPTLTPLAKQAIANSGNTVLPKVSLLDRFAEPEEIAAAAVWMVSDDASYMTGAHIAVDGGVTAVLGIVG